MQAYHGAKKAMQLPCCQAACTRFGLTCSITLMRTMQLHAYEHSHHIMSTAYSTHGPCMAMQIRLTTNGVMFTNHHPQHLRALARSMDQTLWMTPQRNRELGISYLGSQERLRVAVAKLMAGAPATAGLPWLLWSVMLLAILDCPVMCACGQPLSVA